MNGLNTGSPSFGDSNGPFIQSNLFIEDNTGNFAPNLVLDQINNDICPDGTKVIQYSSDSIRPQTPAFSGAIFGVGSNNDATEISGLNLGWNYSDAVLPQYTPLVTSFFRYDTSSTFSVNGMSVVDNVGIAANLVLDATNNDVCPQGLLLEEYVWDNFRPQTRQYRRPITSNYTFYGHHRDATLLVPASFSGTIAITLSQYAKASDTAGSNPELTPTNTVVHVRRKSGPATGTLNVVDQKSGSTLTPNFPAGTDLFYQFNGSNWVSLT